MTHFLLLGLWGNRPSSSASPVGGQLWVSPSRGGLMSPVIQQPTSGNRAFRYPCTRAKWLITPLFGAAQFIIAQDWKYSKGPVIEIGQINYGPSTQGKTIMLRQREQSENEIERDLYVLSWDFQDIQLILESKTQKSIYNTPAEYI